jgi:hypothetical protein
MVLILGAVLMIQLAPGAHGRNGTPPGRTAAPAQRRKMPA